MADFDYSKLAATVTKLLTKFGAPNCRVVRPATNAADPQMPWKGVDGPDEVIVASCRVLLGGLSRLHIGDPATYRGSGQSPEVYSDGTVFMTGADGALARAGDYLEIPTMVVGAYERLAIKKITPLKPGNVNLIWQIELD